MCRREACCPKYGVILAAIIAFQYPERNRKSELRNIRVRDPAPTFISRDIGRQLADDGRQGCHRNGVHILERSDFPSFVRRILTDTQVARLHSFVSVAMAGQITDDSDSLAVSAQKVPSTAIVPFLSNRHQR